MSVGLSGLFGATMIAKENQQIIVENLWKYYNNEVDLGKAKRMTILGAVIAIAPFVFVCSLAFILPYIEPPKDMNRGFLVLFIGLFFLWLFISIRITKYITRKYGHYLQLQNPKSEKLYRWSYQVFFDDELLEYENYKREHPSWRPTWLIEPVVIDRKTFKVLKTI